MTTPDFCLQFSKMSTYVSTQTHQQKMVPNLKPHAQAHLLHPTDKCKICHEAAARHVHYGAMTCFSCRAFFRRSLQNNTSAKYNCMRQCMCEMNIKTRKSCQYCRFMKCLAVGMNPNYVLSEDERRRRFKRRNSSVIKEQKANAVPVIRQGTAKKSEDNFETKKMQDDKEMSKLRNQKQKEENIAYCVSKIICSPENNDAVDPEMRHFKRSSSQDKPNVATYILAHAPTNQNRDSIIIKNGATYPMTKHLGPKKEFLEAENKKLLINQVKTLKNEEQNEYFNKPLFQCPTFTELYANPKARDNKEGKECKPTEKVQESENETSSESEDEIPQKLVLIQEPEMIFTADEKHQLDQLVTAHDTVYHSVNFGEVLIKEMLMCSMFGVAMSTSAAIQGYRLQVERITRIANSLKCFTNLQKVDQVALLKENADLLVSLRGAIFFDTKKKGVDQVMSSMGIEDMETIKKMFKPLIQTHTMNHIDYKDLNSIQDPAAKKIEERYSSLQVIVADSILDNITSILMTYVILFSSDFCSLEDRRTVERTQHHYLGILERLLYGSSSRKSACSKLSHMLNAVTCVREMADIKKGRSITHSAAAQCKDNT